MLLAVACSTDGEPPPPTARLVVVLVEEPLLVGDPSDRPIAAAEVAFDPPAGKGERVTATSGEDGRATFDVPPDALAGGAAVTVFSREHISYSRLDVTEREITLVVPKLDDAAAARIVQLSGTISGKTPIGSTVDLSASRLDRLGRTSTPTEAYALRVPRGQPFFLVGHEIIGSGAVAKSFRIDVNAKEADARLDIDLASAPAIAPRTVRIKVTGPAQMGADAKITASVVSAESSLFLGTPVKSENGDVELSVAETDLAGEHAVTRAAITAADGSRSIRTELGIVADGTSLADFLPPPTIPEASRQQTESIPLADFPAGADLRVEVIAGGKLGWVLVGPQGGFRAGAEKAIALPKFFRVTFPRLIAVTIAAQADPYAVTTTRQLYRRAAVSRDVLLGR